MLEEFQIQQEQNQGLQKSQKQKAAELIISKLSTIIGSQSHFYNQLAICTQQQSSSSVNQLKNEFQKVQDAISQIIPKIQIFENEAVFMNDPNRVVLDPIRSNKTGTFELAISDQIQRIDDELNRGFSYALYNQHLSKRIKVINSTVDDCIGNLMQKF